jgi:clan AA aspartic protease (TIGR02281 family)
MIILAWLSLNYFSITLPLSEPIKDVKILEEAQIPKVIPSKVIEKNNTHKQVVVTLAQLLENNQFYDALAFYLENSTDKNRKQIEGYLATLSQSNPLLALEYMQVFLDNVPESMIWKQIIKTHISQGNLHKAIERIMEAKENFVSEYEDKQLSVQLKDVALQYIDTLMQRKEYAALISFLEEMINYDDTDNFYKFRLAQLYMKLDKVEEASVLLDMLQYDEVYAQNVKSLLNIIDKNEEERYQYAIPLQKYGEHYTVNVSLDDNIFTLLLDTGATYIFLDEDKASMLEVIHDDIVLQTAGNDINAKLCKVKRLTVGNLVLSNVNVTTAPFQREGVDGLLGMNFFKQFSFFINQEESILYLNPRSVVPNQ